jgi:DNA-binding Lrp family transcriptional regulator
MSKSAFTHVRISVESLLDERLSHTDRILLAYWSAFGKDVAGRQNRCFQADATMAKALGMSEKTVANSLSKLRHLGILKGRRFPLSHEVKHQNPDRQTSRNQEADFPKSGTTLPEIGNIERKIGRKIRKTYSPNPSEQRSSQQFPILGRAEIESILEGLDLPDSVYGHVHARMEAMEWRTPENGSFRSPVSAARFLEGLAERMEVR